VRTAAAGSTPISGPQMVFKNYTDVEKAACVIFDIINPERRVRDGLNDAGISVPVI
jgi:hypothetical protein